MNPGLKPWRPGQSGNPLGRRTYLTTLPTQIRERSQGGQELVKFYFAVLRGERIRIPGVPRDQWKRPTIQDRMIAGSWLADRGWGKAKEIVELVDERTAVNRRALLAHLSADERATLERLVDLALARADHNAVGPVIDTPATSVLPQAQDGPDADPS